MAAITSWHRYGTELRHCHRMYLWPLCANHDVICKTGNCTRCQSTACKHAHTRADEPVCAINNNNNNNNNKTTRAGPRYHAFGGERALNMRYILGHAQTWSTYSTYSAQEHICSSGAVSGYQHYSNLFVLELIELRT